MLKMHTYVEYVLYAKYLHKEQTMQFLQYKIMHLYV